LRCPGCGQSEAEYRKEFRGSAHLTLDQFKQIVDPLSSTLLGISLSMRGEPMLNKGIVSFIEYAHSKNIAVSFPTNLSIRLSEQEVEDLVRSGLDSISVSLDGASEETYAKYRVGGNFSLILDNVKSLSDAKHRLGSKRPKIIWKFVVFEHNKHEVQEVRDTYRSLGFDGYELVADDSSRSVRTGKVAARGRAVQKRQGCYWLWHTMLIGWDGKVYPCCKLPDFDLGNAIQENAKDIWRGDRYRATREGFSRKEYGHKMHPYCQRCMGYKPADSAS
jgi:radical SAM protein with 4Fe4S-binding SPASM domain